MEKTKAKEAAPDKNLLKVGALWQNKSEKGMPYFNLDVMGSKYVLFPNSYKEKETQPDFIVYERTRPKT